MEEKEKELRQAVEECCGFQKASKRSMGIIILWRTEKDLKRKIRSSAKIIEKMDQEIEKKRILLTDLTSSMYGKENRTEKQLEAISSELRQCKISNAELCAEVEKVKKELEEEKTKASSLEINLDDVTCELNRFRKLYGENDSYLRHIEQQIAFGEERIKEQRKQMEQNRQTIKEENEKITSLSEEVMLESYMLFKPQINCKKASEYEVKILKNHLDQGKMVKNEEAIKYEKTITINGSESKGNQWRRSAMKQMISSFNIICDNSIANVKFNTYETAKKRIQKAFENINKSYEVFFMSISDEYLRLKVEQLILVHEKTMKEKEEKEEKREIAALKKEEAAEARRLEERRNRIEKEIEKYSNQIKRLQSQLGLPMTEAYREEISEQIKAKNKVKEDLENDLNSIRMLEQNFKAGHVYIISNIGAFGKDVYKIGMTRRLEPEERVEELGNASVPFKFDIHAMIFSDDAPKLESALHKKFEKNRINLVNGRKEFYKVPLEEIEEEVRKNHDKVVEFTYTPFAEQYRESERIRENE